MERNGVWKREAATILIAVAAAIAPGCSDPSVACSSDTICGAGNHCLSSPASSSSWCADGDGTCPSGERWDGTAGDGLAGECVAGVRPDAAQLVDASAARDLAMSADLVESHPDMAAQPDLVQLPDLAMLPDLVQLPDMVVICGVNACCPKCPNLFYCATFTTDGGAMHVECVSE